MTRVSVNGMLCYCLPAVLMQMSFTSLAVLAICKHPIYYSFCTFVLEIVVLWQCCVAERSRLAGSEPSTWRLSLSRSARFDAHDLRGKP